MEELENGDYTNIEDRAIISLPKEWVCSKHDKNLLIALSSNGFEFLRNLPGNKEYGFEDFEIN